MIRLVPRIVTPAPDVPVTQDEAKAFCNIDHGDDDAQIDAFLRTSFEWLQPPFGCLRISIARQTLRLDLPYWPIVSIELPAGPVASIASVKYFDENNADQTLPPSEYYLDNDVLMFVETFSAPQTFCRPSAVRIEYVTGYADAAALPAPLRTAMLQCVKAWYDNRDVIQPGDLSLMALGVDDLIAAWRAR